ncbi:FAD dependent oxidoreductase [Lophiotrema nucula]|uniref:FAD dependent oxidoreductase n=1 Tax=Lophiotrema nucula TaxID=690887 RepID=A0A6A5YQW0_9PLEO|nr:FAD dependent oxidoreductase [Lophiotrema nucula]
MRQILPVPNPLTPYWRSEPHKLDNVRTTESVPSACDIVIIGSGMSGVTTAYHLLHENDDPPNIVILEGRQLCSGATGRNGGHCKVKVPTLAGMIAKLDDAGIDAFYDYVHGVMYGTKKIVDEEELDCEFELRRSFDVQTDIKESERLKTAFDESCAAGRPWTNNTSWVGGKNVEQITSIKGAKSAFSVPASSFWPYKFVTQLLARMLDRHPKQLNVQTTTMVEGVYRTVGEGGENNLVLTSRGNIICSRVVFATNGYTTGLIPQYKNTIVPYKGMASHHTPKVPVHPHLANTYNIDHGPGKGIDYLNPRPDGGIVVGGGKWMYSHEKAAWYNNYDDSTPFPKEAFAYWNGYMGRNFLGWEKSQAEPDFVWVGIQAVTPDGFPHIGRVPGTKNQYVLAGYNGGGMSLVLTAAKTVATMIREEREFKDVAEQLGVPRFFGTSQERIEKGNIEGVVSTHGEIVGGK